MGRELQTLNGQNKLALWAERISECRNSGQNVKTWCKENGICEQTYYKWQRRLFEIAQAQQKVSFAVVTPVQPVRSGSVAVTVRISGAEADIHSGADAVTVETVLRILKSCRVTSPGQIGYTLPAATPTCGGALTGWLP